MSKTDPKPFPQSSPRLAASEPALASETPPPLATSPLLWIIPLLLGAILRALAVWYFKHINYIYPDEDTYWELGNRLLAGHGISLANDDFGGLIRANEPTAYFGALMAPISAALHLVSFGHKFIARLILGEFAWFGTAVPMYAYARMYLSKGRAGVLLALLAIFPNLHFFGSFVMTENVLIPLACIALYVGARIRIRSVGSSVGGQPAPAATYSMKMPWLVCWSILLGIIHLLKMNLLLFQPLQFLIDSRKVPLKQRAIAGAVAVAITGAILLPWAWRNHQVMGAWTLETKSGFNLWLMNNPNRDLPMLKENFEKAPPPVSYDGLATEAQRDAANKAVFREFALAHPVKFIQLCVSRFLIAYALTPVSMHLPRIVAILYGAMNAMIYFFALLGLKQCFRLRWFFDAAGLVVYTLIITALTNAAFRHRSYADPAMLLLAVVGFFWVLDFLVPPRKPVD